MARSVGKLKQKYLRSGAGPKLRVSEICGIEYKVLNLNWLHIQTLWPLPGSRSETVESRFLSRSAVPIYCCVA